MTQVQVEEGKREKERAQEIKIIPFFQRNTPTSVPTSHTPIHDAGGGGGAGRLKEGRAHPQLTVRGTGTLSIYLLKQQGGLCQKDCPNSLGKRSAQLVAMKVVPGDQRTGPGVEPGGHKGDKEIRHEPGPGVPLTFSRGRKSVRWGKSAFLGGPAPPGAVLCSSPLQSTPPPDFGQRQGL